jgi:hypothetical protein
MKARCGRPHSFKIAGFKVGTEIEVRPIESCLGKVTAAEFSATQRRFGQVGSFEIRILGGKFPKIDLSHPGSHESRTGIEDLIWKNHSLDQAAFPEMSGVMSLAVFLVLADSISVLKLQSRGLSP